MKPPWNNPQIYYPDTVHCEWCKEQVDFSLRPDLGDVIEIDTHSAKLMRVVCQGSGRVISASRFREKMQAKLI